MINNYLTRTKNKLKRVYFLITTDDVSDEFEEKSKLSFLRFVDRILNIVIIMFGVFATISLYFFITNVFLN